MAYNFSANQFEGSFKPKKLGNWEVAKWFPERPRAHRTPTKIIADDRGHLLPGVQRAPCSPWGDFQGTWQLPKKISRKTAEELNKPFTRARQSWVKRSSHVPIISPEPLPEPPEPSSEPPEEVKEEMSQKEDEEKHEEIDLGDISC